MSWAIKLIFIFFYDYKVAIEIDEKRHKEKDIDHKLDCRFIRINPDKQGFNICEPINEIHRHISKLTEEPTRKSLTNNLNFNAKKIPLVLV